MKKFLSILTAALLTLLTCVPVCVAETVSEVPGDTDISVYAKYVDNTGFTEIPTDENGSGSITLPDGTEITVSDADKASGRIVVEEVADKEVLDWAEKLLGSQTADFRLFYIYWLNEDGTSQPVSGVTVTIRTADAASNTVCTLNGDKHNKLNAAAKNGIVTFETDGSSFYALCKGAKPSVPDGKTPQTGDDSNPALWLALMLIGGGAAMLAIVFGRRKSCGEI